MGYSQERRESVLKKMLPPSNISITELSKQEGISDATLYNWRKAAREQGRLMPDSDNSSSSKWNSRDKFSAVMETAAMNQAKIASYCREKGVYPEHWSIGGKLVSRPMTGNRRQIKNSKKPLRMSVKRSNNYKKSLIVKRKL